MSVEQAQDAYLTGGLPDMLAQAVAKKMQVVIDTAMLSGVAGNSGIPGLNGETGFVIRHQTGDLGTSGQAPTDTTELGVIAELIRNADSEVTSFVSNSSLDGTYQRIKPSNGTYPMYWSRPADVADVPWVYSANSVLPKVETDPATTANVAQTGGSYSSLYAGDWSRFCYVGMHVDLQARWLNEK